MGLVKTKWMDAQERGWSPPDTSVCAQDADRGLRLRHHCLIWTTRTRANKPCSYVPLSRPSACR
jgi:hypothetical protein